MKKTLIALILGAMSLGAFAQNGGFVSPDASAPGGFKGPMPGMTTVTEAKSLRDDAWVVLEGKIVRQIGHELYEFQDSTGSVNIDIDDKRWSGQTVTPNDKIRIEGEVDKDWGSIEIDVKTVSLIK